MPSAIGLIGISAQPRGVVLVRMSSIVVGDACFCFDQPDGEGGTIPAGQIHRAHLATLRAEFGEVVDTGTLVARLRQETRAAA